MPPGPLPLNPRRLAFVKHFVAGQTATAAARLAGYSEGYAKKSAYHLPKSPAVAAAIEQAKEKLREETHYGLKQAVAEIDGLIADAKAAKQYSAVANLAKLKAQLHGLLIEKVWSVSHNIDIRAAMAEAHTRLERAKTPMLPKPIDAAFSVVPAGFDAVFGD